MRCSTWQWSDLLVKTWKYHTSYLKEKGMLLFESSWLTLPIYSWYNLGALLDYGRPNLDLTMTQLEPELKLSCLVGQGKNCQPIHMPNRWWNFVSRVDPLSFWIDCNFKRELELVLMSSQMISSSTSNSNLKTNPKEEGTKLRHFRHP